MWAGPGSSRPCTGREGLRQGSEHRGWGWRGPWGCREQGCWEGGGESPGGMMREARAWAGRGRRWPGDGAVLATPRQSLSSSHTAHFVGQARPRLDSGR